MLTRSLRALSLIVLLLPSAQAQGWVQRTPATSPPARQNSPLAYDPVRQRVVLFGGWNGTASMDDTWEYDGTTWAQRLPAVRPPARNAHLLLHDPATAKVLLFGGGDIGALNDTWLWDGTTWTQVSPAQSPSPRFSSGIAYFPPAGRILLVGGQLGSSFFEDLWSWDGTTWTQDAASTPIGIRGQCPMVYDAARGRLVLVMGHSNPPRLFWDDTWEYDGTSWSLRTSSSTGTPRSGPALVYHVPAGKALLFGGLTDPGPLGDTLAWDGVTWTQPSATPSPSVREGSSLVFDSARGVSVLFGGSDRANVLADTWEYGTPSPWIASTFAVGAGPQGLTLADLDQDGDLDLATANATSHDLTVRRNDGMGGFGAPPVTLALGGGQGPTSVAAGDLDGDGAADDLAAACRDSNAIAVLANALGVTGQTTIASAGLRPVHLVAGDLNGNARDDLAVAREGEFLNGQGGVEVILDGGPAQSLPGTSMPCVKVALGDLDGDGDQDIAAVARGNPDQIVLWASDGAGGFTAAGTLSLATAGLADGLCCGDLDGDGARDLAVVLPTLFPAASQVVQVWRYTGGGTLDPSDFSATAAIATPGTFGVAAACGDFEDDGIAGFLSRIDLAVANAGSGTVATHHGFDGAVFAAMGAPGAGANPTAVALADLNGDGCDDLAIVNQGGGSVTINLTRAPALVQTYGSGCPGTGGLTPTISGSGPPVLGSSYTVTVAQARAIAPVLLVFGTAPTSLGIGGGCTLLVDPPLLAILRFSNGAGVATLGFGIPGAASGAGFDAFFQALVFDPNGAFGPGVGALSNALRLQLGQ